MNGSGELDFKRRVTDATQRVEGSQELVGAIVDAAQSTWTPAPESVAKAWATAAWSIAGDRLDPDAHWPELHKAFTALANGRNGNRSRDGDPTGGVRRSRFVSAAELARNPDLLKPPECVLPRLAYRGRLGLLAGADKSGKSTTVGHGEAALSVGRPFLGEPTEASRILHVGLEEPPNDPMQRWERLGADLDRIEVLTEAQATLYEDIAEHVTVKSPDLVLIDSLTAYAERIGPVPSDGDNAGWATVLRPLSRLAHESGTAVLILHHLNRGGEEYRGGTEIAAVVDYLLEMKKPADYSNPVRSFKARGRWTLEPFSVVLEDGVLRLHGGAEVPLETRVFAFIQAEGGSSQNAVEKAMGVRGSKTRAAINRLIKGGLVEDRGTSNRSKLWVTGDQTALDWGAES